MPVEVTIVDPDGDAMIILSSSSREEQEVAVEEEQEQEPEQEAGEGGRGGMREDDSGDAENGPEQPISEINMDLALSAGRDAPLGFEHAMCPETRFRVSTKHLSTASRRAKVMFQGPYAESECSSDGLCHWLFEPIFNPKAFEIVMNIIHLRNDKVPGQVTLAELADIAVVVDDLDCRVAVGFFAKVWIGELELGVPSFICHDLARWLMISSVFREAEHFRTATRVVMRLSTGPFDTYGLPINPQIIDRMDSKRQDQIEGIVQLINEEINSLSSTESLCTPECRLMRLGCMVREMRSKELFSPAPSRPFVGHSVLDIQDALKSFHWPRIYPARARLGSYGDVWQLLHRHTASTTRKQKSRLDRHVCDETALVTDFRLRLFRRQPVLELGLHDMFQV